ncbi:hypothetical protein LUZ60_004345 [Juncus effusus]|nr:hypothetical protein LUZ60_004345 [Juncus effusus]
MVEKRQLKDGEECATSRQRQKKSQNIESLEQLKCYLEQLLESKFNNLEKKLIEMMKNRSSSNYVDPPPRLLIAKSETEATMYLKFTNEVKLPVFTHSKLEGEDGTHIKVALFDTNNAKITSGSLSSVKIEIVPLVGDFGDNGNDNWTEEEFRRNIAQDRPKVGPLLKGDLVLELKHGEANLMNISFGDNSSFTPTGKYRLGVRAHESSRKKIREGERIREGITTDFRVKERRVKGSQKLHPPLLDSEIECLEKVGNKSATKLQDIGISTVRQFLQHYFTNEAKLLEILDIRSSDEKWKKMVDHARECSPDDNRLYSYPVMDLNAVFFFNSLYEFVGAKFGEDYINSAEIDPAQKASVLKWKKIFYQNMGGIQVDHQMVNNHPVHLWPTINNVTQYDQVALGQSNLQTISPSRNLIASAENQMQVVQKEYPESSNMPSIGGNMSFMSLLNGGMSFGGSVPSQPEPSNCHIIQQGQVLMKVGLDTSAMNFSTQHVDFSTWLNEEAQAPFTSGPSAVHAGTSIGTGNLLEPTNLQDIFSNLPMLSPDCLDASVTLDHLCTEMLFPVIDQPSVQPDMLGQAIDLPNESKNQPKWPNLIAVVKWKVMLSAVRERKRGEEVASM